MVQYENGEEVFFNGSGFDGESDYKTAVRARIIKGWSVYEIELLGDGNKKGKTMRIFDSSDSPVLQKGPANHTNECSSAKVMNSIEKTFQDFEEEASSFEYQEPSSSDSIRVVQPVIKLCNENGQLRLWVGNTYAISTNKPIKQNNSYSFKGHQLIQGSLCKYEADKANMLRVNFSNQASAEKFYDTYAEMAGFDRRKKVYWHASSVTQMKGLSPAINMPIEEDSPSVLDDQEDMKSSVSSPEIDKNIVCPQFISRDKYGQHRDSELPTILSKRYRRSSEFTVSRRQLASLGARRSSMDVFGSLIRAPHSPSTYTSVSFLDTIAQSPPTDDMWETDKSTNRKFAYAVTDRRETTKNLRVTSKKEKDNNSNKKIDNRNILGKLP